MKIKILLVIPGKEVQTVRIPANTKFIRAFLGDNLYEIRLTRNTKIIASKDATIDEFNRIYKGTILLGTFIIVSTKNNHRVSLKKKEIRKFTNMFSLKKHQKKVNRYKEEYLEEYYCNQRKMKQKNAQRNKKEIFKIAA